MAVIVAKIPLFFIPPKCYLSTISYLLLGDVKETFDKLLQPEKAVLLIVAPPGILMVERFLHIANAYAEMFVTLSGMVTLIKLVHP